MEECFDWLFGLFSDLFDKLDLMYVVPGVSLLSLFIALLVIFILIFFLLRRR